MTMWRMTMRAALVVLSFSALSSASDQIYSNDSLSLTVSSATKSLSVRPDSTVKLQFILMNNGEEGRFIVSQQSRFGLTGTLSLNSLYLATGRQVTLAITDIHVGGREGDRKDFGIRVEREHRGRNRESPPNNWNNGNNGGRPDGNNGGFNNGGNNGGRPDWNNGGNNGGRPDWNNGGNNGGFNDGDNGGRPDWNNGGNNGGRPDWNNGGNNGNNGGFNDGDNGGRPDWNNGGNNGGRPDWNNGGNNGGRPDWNNGGHNGGRPDGNNGGNNGNNGGFNDGDNGGRPDWNNGGHNGGRPDGNNGGNNGNNGGFNDGDNGGRPDWNNGGNNGGRPDWNNGGNNDGRPDWNNGGNNGNNGGFNDGGNGGRPDWDNGGHNGNNGGNGGRPDGNNGGNGWNDGRPDYRPGHRSSIEKMVEFHLSEHHETDYDEPVAAAGYVENAECEEEDSCRSKYWTAPFSAEDPGSGLWSVKFDGGDVVFWHDPIMVGSTRAVTGRFRVNCCTEEVEMKVKDVAGMTLRRSVSRGGNGGESLDTVMIFVIIGAGILVVAILLIGGVCLWKKKYSSVSQNDA